MLPFLKPHNDKKLMWVLLVLVALLLTIGIGCSSQPEVVVVEKEVIKEVVVTATPAPISEATQTMPVAKPTVTSAPTPELSQPAQVAEPTATPKRVSPNPPKEGVGLAS